jgi:hypothetical protein
MTSVISLVLRKFENIKSKGKKCIQFDFMAEATTITPLKIGIDFGGVLSIHDRTRVSDDEEEHQSIEINMPDALTSLIKLKEAGHQLYLISYCGKNRANETNKSILKILPNKNFFHGIYFVKKISFKANVCQAIGCDLMIDDRLKILNHIHHVIPTMKLLWFSSSEENHSPDFIRVNSWSDVIKTIDDFLVHQAIRHKADSRILLDDKLQDV